MNTHESYVSLETAKILKEAGFDWECSGHWVETNKDNKDALLVLPSEPCLYDPNLVDDDLSMYMICVKNWNAVEDEIGFQFYYSAPTLALVQKWLREVKQCYVQVYPMFSFEGVLEYYFVEVIYPRSRNIKPNEFNTYEEAQEAGIKKALEIILEKVNEE